MEKKKNSKLEMLFDENDKEEKTKNWKKEKLLINREIKSYYIEKNFENFDKKCIEHTSTTIVGLCMKKIVILID